jgi:hypothetical protein
MVEGNYAVKQRRVVATSARWSLQFVTSTGIRRKRSDFGADNLLGTAS